MKTTMINTLWALLLVGAYYVGTTQRSGNPAPNSLVETAPEAMRKLPNGMPPPKGTRKSASGSADADGWLNTFRGPQGRISAGSMEEAVAAILLESDPVTANLHFALLLEELTPENAPLALQALKDSGGAGNASQYMTLLAHAWGRLDGEAAVMAFETLRGRGSESAKTTALAAWAAIDPAAATKWLQERASTDDRRADAAWSRGLLTGLARRDVDAALQYLTTMMPNQQDEFVGVLIEEKLKEGVIASADWALQLPGEDMRTNALESVGMRFLQQDLDGAMLWAASIADRPDAHEAVADVADGLASRDPAEAVAWVSSLPAGPSQDHAYEDLFENWTRSDPLAASESLTRMEPGTVQDNAIQAFSKTLARENPEDALVWAGAITDPKQRGDLQVDLIRRWQRSSPTEAEAWIASNLPEDLQARVLPQTP